MQADRHEVEIDVDKSVSKLVKMTIDPMEVAGGTNQNRTAC